ncbi:MAG: HD domain-containing protein [Clostridium sp.]|nr:HD domain-containing protein [Clostridium sp.]
MEYIHSKDIFLLMRDTLKLVDRRAMDHGSRVAYYLYKMLEHKGGYEKFELADFAFMASMHDIGAYKTDNPKDVIQYEMRRFMPHSTYGYLVFKYLSPISELASVILYHHTDYSQLKTLKFEYKDITAYLNLAEKIDIYSMALGDKFELNMFDKQIDKVVSKDAVQLFQQAEEEYGLLEKVRKGDYREELDDIISYLIFTNADKVKYLEMLMYCQGFRRESAVVNTVTCMCICEVLGQRMGLNGLEREQLRYGALLHDIGMVALPNEIVNAPRPLTEDEYKKVRMHVHLAERALNNRMAPEVVEIVAAHHERCDGSGYPRGLREVQMNTKQEIVQLADAVTALLDKRSYREAFTDEEMQEIIRQEMEAGKYNKTIVKTFLDYYEEIMERVNQRVEEILSTYRKLNLQYRQVSGKMRGKK